MQIEKSPQKTQAQQQQKPEVKFGPFNVFSIIKKSHNNYGIKNTDYRRYRNYCARKIRKIRKSINYKFGTKNKFIKKDILKDNFNYKKVLQIALWKSEKYWAEANETKYSPHRNPAHKSRARFVSIKKLKRAITWSNALCKITNQKSTYLSTLQSNAYKFYLQGMLAFQQQAWSEAQTKLIAAREIMDQLMKTSTSISNELFKQKMDQFDQTIKFCNFKISKGKQMSISQIIEMKKIGDANLSSLIENLTQQRMNEISLQQKQYTGINEIRFGSERYPVKHEQIKIQKSRIDSEMKVIEEMKSKAVANLEDEQLEEELLQMYSKVVVLIEEAVKLCDQERQANKKSNKYNEAQLQVLRKICLLLQQSKISLFIDRSYTIFRYSYRTSKSKKSSPQTLAKLLTSINNSFVQLADIIKEKHQLIGTSPVEELKSIDEKTFYIRTLRLLFVGQVYFNNDKVKEAYGLWSQCEKGLRILQSKQQMKNQRQLLEQQKDPLRCTLISLPTISQQLKQFKLKCIVKNYKSDAKSKSEVTKMMDQIKVNQDKNEYEITLEELIHRNSQDGAITLQKLSQIDIIRLPGNLQPVPTRPIFFDIYQTQLHYPSLEGKVKKSKGLWGNIISKFYK